MADLNALIAQGAQFRQPESQLNMMAQMQQLQQGQSTNQLNQMKIAEAQRGMEEQTALRSLYAGSAGQMESPEFLAKLAARSPTAYQAHLKFLGEQAESKAKLGLTAAQTGAATAKTKETALDIKSKQKDFINRSLSEMSRNPSDANIIAFGEDAVLDGHLTPEQAKVKTEQLLAMPISQRQQYLSTQGLNNKDTAELFQSKPLEQTDGQTKWMVENNPRLPNYGQRMAGAKPITMLLTPGEQSTASTAAAGQKLTARGQDITAATAANRLAQEAQGVTYQPDAQGNIIAVPSKLAPGVAPVARPVIGEAGVLVKGKPSAFAEKTAVLQKQQSKDINLAITEIENAIKPGGLLDKSTASGAGRLYDIGAGFFGNAPEGAIAAASLKPIADLGLKMVPRFEGPQSNADTISYKEASGQLANESLPIKVRRAAAQTMIRIMKSRKGQFANEAMAAEGIAPSAPSIAPPTGFTPDQQ